MGSADHSGNYVELNRGFEDYIDYPLSIKTELYHLHGRLETAATGERSATSYPTRARHGIRKVQGEQGLGRAKQDGFLV